MSVHDLRDHSLFRMVSLGVVAENKLRSSDVIEVTLQEIHPFINGEIRADITTDTVSGVNSMDHSFSVSVNMSNTVTAKWKGDGTNRITPPDVRRGDVVEVWQYGEVNIYYWTIRSNPGVKNVRKLETVTNAYSNTRDENDNTPTAENSWFDEVNTHDKLWTLAKTNKKDGEPFAYVVQINAKDGVIVMADDAGNYFQMDSKEQRLELVNSHGSSFDLHKGKLTIKCEDLEIDASNSITTKTKTATHTTNTTTYKASNWNVQVSQTAWQGNIGQTGNFSGSGGSMTYTGVSTFTGATTFNGNATITSNLSVGGSGTFGGRVSASNI